MLMNAYTIKEDNTCLMMWSNYICELYNSRAEFSTGQAGQLPRGLHIFHEQKNPYPQDGDR